MRSTIILCLGVLSLGPLLNGRAAAQPASLVAPAVGRGVAAGAHLLTPDLIADERGQSIAVQRGLLFVPENRSNPASRLIAVPFTRFPASTPQPAGRAPVFLLPGGPGWDFDFTEPLVFDEIQRLRRTRDVISVSQRGYPGTPGLTPAMWVTFPGGSAEAPTTAVERAAADRATLASAVEDWRRRGVDPTGYDIVNITDDLNDLRRALGYEQIVLRGCSFGSQWSLAYMKRWPATVERAFLSGVEPLDFGYDSPDALWASMARVASAAEADPDLAPQIPSGGLMQALKTVVARLEAQPVKVTVRSPAGAEDIVVPVGADDLRLLLTSLSLGQRRPLENLAHWPRFILELHRGDYRYLAVRTAQSRARERSEALILPLLNHSIGIGARRAARLKAEPAARWLGDLNLKESITRTVAPTRQVDDAFRIDAPIRTPVLLLSGDYDWSTPVENAQHLANFLPNGRHVVVKGGRHCGETNFGEVAVQSPEALDRLYGFLDADFQRTPPKSFLASLPAEIVLKPIDFAPVVDRSLYDEWLSSRR